MRQFNIHLNLFLVAVFLVFSSNVVLFADEPAAESADVPPASESSDVSVSVEQAPVDTQSEPVASDEGTAEEGPVTATGNVTIDFKDADIQNVLRILSYKSGVNIVAGKDVTGSVTIRLVDVPWEKALDVVLKTYGYAYDRDENIIRVTTLENLKKEELSTEVYTLNYSQAAEVEKSIKDVLSERGKMRADNRSNTLIVTDMPTALQRISKVVQRLDKVTPQVVIEAKVIETALGETERLGIDWNLSAKLTGSLRPTSFPFAAQQRSFLYKFFPDNKGTSTTSILDGSGSPATVTENDFSSRSVNSSFPAQEKADFKYGTMDFTEFQVLLEAIASRNDTKVLSEPHIMTLNNQTAKILVGEVISIPTFERNSTTGRMEITGYKDRDLGIRLTVVPQINDQDEIVVNIHPEITTLLGYDALTAEVKAPRFSTREAVTQVRIKTGQTIAIGGLIRENLVDQKKKIPFLGDIPLLEAAFKHTDKTVQKTDLLFFLTVNIVKDQPL